MRQVKDIFDIIIETLLFLIIAGGVLYFVLCAGVYTAFAGEVLTKDERVVALTLLGEARGEGYQGMYAVGCVIQKRATERNLTPAQVCLQPKQFSIWNGKKERDLHYLNVHLEDGNTRAYARMLARHIVKGDKLVQAYTGNANHYYSKKLKRKPYWAKGKKPVAIIKNHVFYRLN